ncbi:hypothetical protein C2G38_2228408 [Gigaspora rosea]|uniref:Uncharacterized protein n=1 Tax=Gigaspora rosea TaxID=44941 RepID=A0A397TVU3_9GLOM|nr:hypothetical protein C2G38_2228408 [Gigaspora rosea]
MCTNSTNKLIVNKQLVLQKPEVFFEKYENNQKYEIYINEHISKNKKNKVNLIPVLNVENLHISIFTSFEFGEFQPLRNFKKAPSNKLITENTNSCNEPNHPFTNYLQNNETVELRFPDLEKMKLFFKTYID